MQAISKEWYGTLLASGSAIFLGFVALLGTELLHDKFAISNMLFWRFLIAAAATIAYVTITGQVHAERKTVIKQTSNLIIAALLYSSASALYFVATEKLGTGLGVALFFCFPLFVTLFSYLFGDYKIDKFTIIALAAICIGIAMIHGHLAKHTGWKGLGYAILTAFTYAAYVYRSRAISKAIEPIFLTLLVCIGNTIIFFAFTEFRGEFMVPHNLQEWFYVLTLGIIGTALPIQLLLESLKYISAVKASVLASQQVVVTLILGVFLLHEQISMMQFIGVLVLLLGSITIQKEH